VDAANATIDEGDRKLLLVHYAFYRALDLGSRTPTTPAQEHFLAVCRGTATPETEHERAYFRLKCAVAVTGIDEAVLVASGFVLSSAVVRGAGELAGIPARQCFCCGRLIPPERLEAIPETTRCVTCQGSEEAATADWHRSEIECPRCATRGVNSRLVWRTARDPANFAGYFLGCSLFPECRYVDRS
jgi:hypothetical protein